MTKTIVILCVISLAIVVVISAYLMIDNIVNKKKVHNYDDKMMSILNKALAELGIKSGYFDLVYVKNQEGFDIYLLVIKNNGIYLVYNRGEYVKVESELI